MDKFWAPETFDLGEHGTTTLNVYRYNHDYKKLYREFELDTPVRLEGYEAPYFEQAFYKLILLIQKNDKINILIGLNFPPSSEAKKGSHEWHFDHFINIF